MEFLFEMVEQDAIVLLKDFIIRVAVDGTSQPNSVLFPYQILIWTGQQ